VSISAIYPTSLLLTSCYSVDDDVALRNKVDEAMAVYDAYMKERGPKDGANGTGEEAGAEATAA
jgi:hypothetical protein